MKMANLEEKIDHKIIIKSLQEMKKLLPLSNIVNVPKLLNSHHKLLSITAPQKLEKIACRERESVKDFILDETFRATDFFSPRVIQSLVKSIEDKINDN